MKKLLLLGAILTIGCHDPASPDDFRITVLPVPASVQAGQTMQLKFEIRNESDEGRYLGITGCFPPYEILDSSGHVVGPGPRVCSLSLSEPLWLDAHSTLSPTFIWTGDATGTTPSGGPVYLPPGTYQVRPFVDVLDVGKTYGPAVSVTIVP